MLSKKIVPVLIAGLTAASLSACSQAQKAAPESVGSIKTDSEKTNLIEEKPEFEKSNYNGEKFNILAPASGMYTKYFFTDEMTGEVMNDAIYERMINVEDYLGIDIDSSCEGTIGEIMGKIKSCVMSGDDTYQLVLTHCFSNVGACITEGLLYNWNDFEYCDLSKSYWNQNCNENLSIGTKQYYAISDYMLANPNAILFNKDMIDSYSLENPYALVHDGNWTLDKMIGMSSKVTADLNGDSVYDINDKYGISCDDDWEWNSFIYSSGISIIGKDSAGKYKVTINSERMVSLIEKLDHLLNGTNDAFIWPFGSADDKKLTMSSGRVLFQIVPLQSMNLYRDTEVDFGILPYPKFDKAQEKYQTNDWSGLMCVPLTVGNPEMVGKACELLAYYSGTTTIPAYYDLLLGEKLSRDVESKEMLDIIYDNIVYDPGLNFLGFAANVQKLFYTVKYYVIGERSGSFATWYAQWGPGAEATVTEFFDKVEKLEK